MPPRSYSDRSPVSVTRWPDDQSSCSSSAEIRAYSTGKPKTKAGVPLVKSVKWAEQNHVLEIPHINLIPEDVIAQIWYNAKEYAEIKQSYQMTIFMMESGESITGDDHTTRGLEYRTQEGAWARYENKRDAYNAVLDEQDEQWKNDVDDQDAISQVYLEHSAKCLKAAAARGRQDHMEVLEIVRADAAALEKKGLTKKKKKKSSSGASGTSSPKPVKGDRVGNQQQAQQLLKERSNSKRTEVRNDIKREIEKKQSKSSKSKRGTSSV